VADWLLSAGLLDKEPEMGERCARYGLHTYAVRVSQLVAPGGEVYFDADSVTIGPSGSLMMAVEVEPFENNEQEGGIENAPYVLLAPGQWYSAILIERTSRRPYFEWLGDDIDPDHKDE
jgi:hypothetical protein